MRPVVRCTSTKCAGYGITGIKGVEKLIPEHIEIRPGMTCPDCNQYVSVGKTRRTVLGRDFRDKFVRKGSANDVG